MVDEADMCFASVATVFATRHNFGLNLSPQNRMSMLRGENKILRGMVSEFRA